ncbi:MAG TPA: thiamine pyrophosphate-dependent enzyme [Trebonia sp.]|nr:thiamine pyrophosphate-dependent enzyme [Trebonia sp.]
MPELDDGWVASLRAAHLAAAGRLAERARALPPGADGFMHPCRLLDGVSRFLAPDAAVVAVIGDGSFGFTAMEVDTAVRHGLAPVYVIANNRGWNIEKTDQLQRFAGRAVGVDLPGCRYDQLAVALGAAGRRVTDPGELPAALAWARDHAPAVLDVMVTQDAQSPDSASGIAIVPPDQALTKWQLAEEQRTLVAG